MSARTMTLVVLALVAVGCRETDRGVADGGTPSAPRPPDAGPPAADARNESITPKARLRPSRTPLLDGKTTRFTLTLNQGHFGLSTLSATLMGRPAATARFSEDGRTWVVLGHVPIATKEKTALLRIDGTFADEGPFVLEQSFPIERAPYDERKIHVPKKYVKPPKAARKRAAQEKKLLAKVLETPHPERLWRGSFVRPTDTEETSPFGTLRTYNRRRKPSRHLGWDLDGHTGDPIRAAQTGKVVLVQDRYYSGGTVIIDHGQSLYTLYFHMSAFDVAAGDLVQKGQLIGKVGKSGRVTGPHLHFSIKLGGLYTDPQDLLALDLSDDPLDEKPIPRPEGVFSKLDRSRQKKTSDAGTAVSSVDSASESVEKKR